RRGGPRCGGGRGVAATARTRTFRGPGTDAEDPGAHRPHAEDGEAAEELRAGAGTGNGEPGTKVPRARSHSRDVPFPVPCSPFPPLEVPQSPRAHATASSLPPTRRSARTRAAL